VGRREWARGRGQPAARKRRDINQRDDLGRTPLWFAVQKGDVAVVEQLLSYGADIDSVGDGLMPPLGVGT
jgi:ankyrin repeat protein